MQRAGIFIGVNSTDHLQTLNDAPLTAPEAIQAQPVQGGTIFPNTPGVDERFVDLYYACGLRRAVADLRTQDDSVTGLRPLAVAAT